MSLIKKTSFAENLENYNTFIRDTAPNSRYFNITELPDTFTGGKNAFLIAGSNELVADTIIKIEIKDSAGNVIYNEPGEGTLTTTVNGQQFTTEYYEGVSKVVAVYVYPDTTAYGPCTITILGELSSYYDENGLLTPIPLNWQNTYNVKWQKSINVNPTLANTTKIRFYRRPAASISEVISPVYRIENGIKVNTGINQSFANIKISNLETFAGDVKRIKVFRTSLGDISDYDLIQDILVESKELLTSYGLSGSVVGQTGIFTSETLQNFWNTGSLTSEITSSRVESGLKLNGSGNLTYSSSLELKSTNTYELNLDAFYSASTDSNLGIYLSGSDGGNILISTLNGISPTKNLLDTTIPFKLDNNFASASLYFSQSQGEWHLGNISLKLSEDTAFSPDEVSFVTTMPTVVGNEDFNFKFEFYDVNNNYVPVNVTGSGNFTGGSNAITKLLTFESDRTAFRFSSGSVGNPPTQFVRFKTQRTNFTGSLTYSSASFDVDGNYIVPASYAGEYPGALSNVSDAGALLSIAKFSGSVSSVIVGSIVYTASCEGVEEYETIYRFEDGDNAPGVFVTSDTNQFIYKATDLSLNPSGQIITIEAKRKNLASATTPLTINSGSGQPGLTFVSTNATNGVDTYTLDGSSYSYLAGETTYYVSGSDQFGNEFSDAIKITPVKILDGLSATLTNDNASLPALSNGFVASGSFALTSGSVSVKVGNETITFDDDNDGNRANNTFAITNISGIGCTPNSSNPTDNSYGITNLSADSGSLDITIDYKDGAGDSTSLVKTVTYTKNKKAAPVLTFVIGNNNQSTDAKSTGEQITSFSDSTLSVKEQYNGSTSTLTLSSAPTINSSSAFTPITKTTTNLSYPTMSSATDSVELSITGSVTDSEGVSRQVFGNVSLTKIKKAAPILSISTTNKAQSVSAKSTGEQIDAFSNATVTVSETYNGSTSNLTITSLTATSSDIASISTTAASGLVTLNGKTLASGTNSTTITITAVVTDSEGVSRTVTDTISLAKVKKAPPTITFAITPSAQTVAANSAGTLTGTIVDPVLTAFEGSSALTYNQGTLNTSEYKITNVTGVTVGSTTPSTSTIDVTGVSSTDNTGIVTISYVDSEGTSGTSTIKFTISKAIAGEQGVDGDPGADGKRTATGTIYYQVTAASAPSTPSATSYTFSTNSFGGLTANWAVGAPTYTAGNSNKYWYSTYTAVETTAGGGTAVPTFSSPAQAINFTGLVTFTSANNITDGTNTSNIVEPGSVTNHIGGANVTTIEGGKISTGVITSTGYSLPSGDTLATGTYTTAGTIFNLDNGSLRSKNFYVNSSGDAFFKGALSGASGTFSGALSGGTISIGSGNSIFKADTNGIYLGNATFASAPFRVTAAGALTATGATISGAITATSLTLSGTTIPAAGVSGLAAVATSGNASDVGLGNVQNLNAAGQATSGIEASITINSGGIAMGTGGFIRGGQTDYNTGTGFFLGRSGGAYKFSIGDGSTKGITWDGDTLTIGGNAVIGASTISTIASNANAALQPGANITSLNNNAGFQANGDAKTGGSVGGWTIASTNISSNNGQTILYNTGIISLTDGSTERIKITKDNLSTTTTNLSTTTSANGSNQLSSTYGTSWNYGASRVVSYDSGYAYSSGFNITQDTLTLAVSYPSSATGQSNGQIGIGTAFQSGISSIPNYSYSTYTFTARIQIILEYYNGSSWVLVGSSPTIKEIYRETFSGASAGAVSTGYAAGTTSAAFNSLNIAYQYRVGTSVQWIIQNSAIAYTFQSSGLSWYLYTNQYGLPSQSLTITALQLSTKLEIGLNGIQISSGGGLTAIGAAAGTGLAGTFTGDVTIKGQLTAAAVVSSSDRRLKTDIQDIDSPMVKISQLNPKYFLWNDSTSPLTEKGYSYGFIAQDVQTYFPELVKVNQNSTEYENLLSLDYNAITALNTSVIKELVSKIEKLEDRILELEEIIEAQ